MPESPEIETAIAALASDIKEDIESLLARDFGLEPFEDMCLSDPTIYEIARSTYYSMEEIRLQYPGKSISLLKYVSNAMFWIIKLKPISSTCLLQKGELVDAPNINEHIAMYWGICKLLGLVRDGRLPELVMPMPKNLRRFERVVRSYIKGNMYRDTLTGEDIPETEKYYETVYYMRFKKFTAVNLYEIFMHMIVVYRSFGRSSRPLGGSAG